MVRVKKIPSKKATASKQKKTLEEMTIADVLKTNEFVNQMQKVMRSVELQRTNWKEIIELRAKEKWSAGEMTVLYALANEKKIVAMPKRLRDFIIGVGLRAFKNTIAILKAKQDASEGDK